jgi:predicted hydrocarbon binding protein
MTNLALLKNLEDARNRLELSKSDWATHYLRISEDDYEGILSQKKEFSAVHLFHLTEKLWINPSDFEKGTVDFDSLLQARQGKKGLNPRYTVAAKSRKHTVINSLNFVEHHRGPHLRTAVNRHFQIQDDFWTQGHMDQINIRFIGDLFKFLRDRGFTDRDFKHVGENSVLTLRGTEIGHAFSKCGSAAGLYEMLIGELITRFEENCSYKISSLSRDRCVLESISNAEVAEAFGSKHTGSRETCLVRVGIFSSLPTYIGLNPATVHETHCVHRGDRRCRFLIDYSLKNVRDTGVRLMAIS